VRRACLWRAQQAVPTSTDPMGILKNTREFKAPGAGKWPGGLGLSVFNKHLTHQVGGKHLINRIGPKILSVPGRCLPESTGDRRPSSRQKQLQCLLASMHFRANKSLQSSLLNYQGMQRPIAGVLVPPRSVGKASQAEVSCKFKRCLNMPGCPSSWSRAC